MLKLILIDDDSFALETLNELIPWNEFNFKIDGVFSDSEKAIEHIRTKKVDCIITDIRMPSPDGMDIVRLCAEQFPRIKIVLLSAYRDFQYAQAAIQFKNVVDYVTKPIDYLLLKKALENLSSQFVEDKFQSDETLDLKLQIFSDIICGYLTDISEIQEQLSMLNVKFDPETTAFSVINFHISDFNSYIKSQWTHETVRFYHALAYLVPFETADTYFALALYSHGNISWVAVHKNDRHSESVRSFAENFIRNGQQLLSFDAELNSFNTYKNIYELQKSSLFYNDKNVSDDTIDLALEYMNTHYGESISLETVSEHVFMSPSYFSTYFKQHTGQKFIDALTQIRMNNAERLLVNNPKLSISDICTMVGYNHLGHFHKTFKKHFNSSPNEYRTTHKKYRGD